MNYRLLLWMLLVKNFFIFLHHFIGFSLLSLTQLWLFKHSSSFSFFPLLNYTRNRLSFSSPSSNKWHCTCWNFTSHNNHDHAFFPSLQTSMLNVFKIITYKKQDVLAAQQVHNSRHAVWAQWHGLILATQNQINFTKRSGVLTVDSDRRECVHLN